MAAVPWKRKSTMTNVKSPKHPLSCDSRPTTTGRLGTSLDGGSNMSSSFHMRGDRKAGEKASCALRSVRWPWRAACAIAADMRALRGDMRPDMSSPPRLLATLRTDGACSDRSPPPSSCAPPPAAAAACSPVASSSAPRCSGSSVFSSSMALPFSASPPPPCPSAPPVLFVEGGKKKWKCTVPILGAFGVPYTAVCICTPGQLLVGLLVESTASGASDSGGPAAAAAANAAANAAMAFTMPGTAVPAAICAAPPTGPGPATNPANPANPAARSSASELRRGGS